jgi:hypothetical protein
MLDNIFFLRQIRLKQKKFVNLSISVTFKTNSLKAHWGQSYDF